MIELQKERRFLPIHLVSPQESTEVSLQIGEELESLIETYDGVIVDRVVQKLLHPDPKTFIGRGKLGYVEKVVKEKHVDVVVLNAIVKPGQLHTIQKILWEVNPQIEVWDRVDLILQIFQKHAKTREAKLQIELAQMRHMGPRIYGMGMILSRQGGGIGTLGVGETNTELMKRHWQDQMKQVTGELAKLGVNRSRQLERRQRIGLRTVSLIGYTNAGKTSLYNLLTKKHKLAENKLFATLDSSVGRLYLPGGTGEVLVSDTIGFIRNLPTQLIEAFTSTLMESLHADLLVHVIDVSDPAMEKKIKAVEQILRQLHADTKPQIYVFNKIDQAHEIDKPHLTRAFAPFSPLFISTKQETGISALRQVIEQYLHEATVSPYLAE